MKRAVGLGVAVVCWLGFFELAAKESSNVPYSCQNETQRRRFMMAYRSRYGYLDRLWGYYLAFNDDDACEGLDVFLREHDDGGRSPSLHDCWGQGRGRAEEDFVTDVRQECCAHQSGQAGRQAAEAYCEQLLEGGEADRPPLVARRHCDEMARQSCAFTFSRTVWFHEDCRQRLADEDPEADALYRLANEVCAP